MTNNGNYVNRIVKNNFAESEGISKNTTCAGIVFRKTWDS